MRRHIDDGIYIVTKRNMQLCTDCQNKNPFFNSLSYSVFLNKESIWKLLKAKKRLIISTTEKNKDVADIILRRFTEDGMAYEISKEGPVEIKTKNLEGEEKIMNVYKYEIKISAALE